MSLSIVIGKSSGSGWPLFGFSLAHFRFAFTAITFATFPWNSAFLEKIFSSDSPCHFRFYPAYILRQLSYAPAIIARLIFLLSRVNFVSALLRFLCVPATLIHYSLAFLTTRLPFDAFTYTPRLWLSTNNRTIRFPHTLYDWMKWWPNILRVFVMRISAFFIQRIFKYGTRSIESRTLQLQTDHMVGHAHPPITPMINEIEKVLCTHSVTYLLPACIATSTIFP